MYSSISKNKRNTILIFTVFIAIISGIGLFVSYIFDSRSVFWYVFLVAVIYAAVNYAIATKIAIFATGAEPISRSDAPELYSAVDWISQTAGLPQPKVYIINDSAPNAFAAGTSPNNAVICATTGLLEIMNKSELEGVIAHEMSHIKNYDVRVSMAALALTGAISLISDLAFRMFIFSDDDRDRSINPIVIIVGIILLILAPFLALITNLAISRQREYLADASAVMLTRYPDGLISALQKLQQYSTPMKKQFSGTANLFITSPSEKSFLKNMFSTHPPLEDRINRLKENSSRF